MLNTLPVLEPQWWKDLLVFLNTAINAHESTRYLVPLLADVFVFSYPLFLVLLYGYGILKNSMEEKKQALMVFLSALGAAFINIIIQSITEKQRPELYITAKDNLLLSHLPTDPFPSDHAAVSAAIAMSTLILAVQTKNKLWYAVSIFFRIASLTMSFARVAVAVHRPTDVLVGTLVWSFVAYVILASRYRPIIEKKILHPLISLEKYIVWLVRKRA